jgi:hypothetical protein
MLVPIILFLFNLAAIRAEDSDINFEEVVPIQSLKAFWDNNDLPEIVRPKDEDFLNLEKTEARIVNGYEAK